MTEVVLDGESLTPEDVEAVARDGATVAIADSAREAIRESRARIEDVLDSGETVYGLNTGFGELVDERIPSEQVEALQTNLVRSHAAGAGRELTREEVRALMVTRINALCKGFSGIREVVVDHLRTMLNEGVHPVVKSRGSLGASGDLAPLAHVALTLIGEGEARVEPPQGDGASGEEQRDDPRAGGGPEGHRLAGGEALAAASLEPLTLRAKEGLALINGTQLTVGIAALLVCDAERVVKTADVAGGLTTEVTMSTTASCDPAIQAVRPHPGQAKSARNVKRTTADSEIVESHRNCDRVQDAYSVRCLPQVHGAIREAISHLRDAVEVELNSATDNPLIFPADEVDSRASGTDEAAVLSGGNFHGEPLALRLDYLVSAVTELAAISERRIDRMLNPNLQEPHLPPFLTEHSGLQSGYMIGQYTAASLLNENRAIGRPSMDNTPVSGNQEDHVSMSAQSAYGAQTAVANARTVVAIELLCATQALEFVDSEAPRASDSASGERAERRSAERPSGEEQRDDPRGGQRDPRAGEGLVPGVGSAAAYETIRDEVPPLVEDRPIHRDIEAAETLVRSGELLARVEKAVGANLE